MTPQRLAWFLLICSGIGSALAQESASLPVVALQPLGEVPPAIIAATKAGAEARLRIRVEVLPTAALPKMAYYPPRERYRAEKLLKWLEENPGREPGRYLKIIGLTTQDISTTKRDVPDWGVFGLGSLGGQTCVISTRRLRPKDGQPEAILLERLIKVVHHEIGHTFGLEHCPTDRCVMQDAQGSILTVDREDGTFCAACVAKLAGHLR